MKRMMILAGVVALALAACGSSGGSSADSATKDTCKAIQQASPPNGGSMPVGQLRDGLYTISQRAETANADPRLLPALKRLVDDYSNGTLSGVAAENNTIAQVCK